MSKNQQYSCIASYVQVCMLLGYWLVGNCYMGVDIGRTERQHVTLTKMYDTFILFLHTVRYGILQA